MRVEGIKVVWGFVWMYSVGIRKGDLWKKLGKEIEVDMWWVMYMNNMENVVNVVGNIMLKMVWRNL